MKTDKFKKYCSNCGGDLIRIPVRADKLFVPFHDCSYPLGTRYNIVTGHKQYGILVKCTNKKWYNSCDKWIVENSLHDAKF